MSLSDLLSFIDVLLWQLFVFLDTFVYERCGDFICFFRPNLWVQNILDLLGDFVFLQVLLGGLTKSIPVVVGEWKFWIVFEFIQYFIPDGVKILGSVVVGQMEGIGTHVTSWVSTVNSSS